MEPTEAEKIKMQIARLTAQRDELEKALPPHGVKPDHLRRIEDLEEQIAGLKSRLAKAGQSF
jgi:hypothetical protein